jgi:hypothetical protein
VARIAALTVGSTTGNVLVSAKQNSPELNAAPEGPMEPAAQEHALSREQFEQMLREATEFETVRRAAYAVLAGRSEALQDTFERRTNPIAAVTEAADRLRDYMLWRETETEMLEAASHSLETMLMKMRRQRRSDYNQH